MEIKSIKTKVSFLIDQFFKTTPNPVIELFYVNNFTLLIAILLSAQTTDKAVNLVTKDLFLLHYKPEHFRNLTEEQVHTMIKKIGLARTKAKNIMNLSKLILESENQIPLSFEELIKLPGVGRKTANVFLSTIDVCHKVAVDTHVYRVLNRIGFMKTKSAFYTDLLINSLIPIEYKKKMHHWLVLHGRYICRARKPSCKTCIINNICQKNLTNRETSNS